MATLWNESSGTALIPFIVLRVYTLFIPAKINTPQL